MGNKKKMKTKFINNSVDGEKNPYKGLVPYSEEDYETFFGRDKDKESLFELVKYNKATVLLGKSGLGKSSLLNAGLIPLLRDEDFLPIRLRYIFSDQRDKDKLTYKDQIRTAFKIAFEKALEKKNYEVKVQSNLDGIPVSTYSPDETLWEYFRRTSHFYIDKENRKRPLTPVLVIDQFEEIFTIGKNHEDQKNILDELYWLIENQLPMKLRKFESMSDSDKEYAEKISNSNISAQFKIILSLREEFLPHLFDLKLKIPSIGDALFRVSYLKKGQAIRIITGPTNALDSKETIDEIIAFVNQITTGKDGMIKEEHLEIEPALLSLLCYQMFKKKEFKTVTKKSLDRLLQDYYDSHMKKYPGKVLEYIEFKLLTETGFRTPHYIDENHPLKNFINNLVDSGILRKFHDGHKEYVEIVHDFLAKVIEDRRDKRIRKKRRTTIIISSVISTLLLLLSLWALYQKQKVEVFRLTTEAYSELRTDNTRAIRIAEAAVKKAWLAPPLRTYQALNEISYSSFERPFYLNITDLSPTDDIHSAVFTKDNQIITAHEDGTVRIRNLAGEEILKINAHKKRAVSVKLFPDGKMFLSASFDKTAALWNFKGKRLQVFEHPAKVIDACISQGGKYILSSSWSDARLWNLQGQLLQEFEHQSYDIPARMSPDGQYILTTPTSTTARIYDFNGQIIIDLKKHTNTLTSATFLPQRDENEKPLILTTSWDHKAVIWNLKGKAVLTVDHGSRIIHSLVSSSGKKILTAGLDGSVRLWDMNGREINRWLKHETGISAVANSQVKNFFLTAAEDGSINLLDSSGNLRSLFGQHKNKIRALSVSPNNRYLFSSSENEKAVLWDLEPNTIFELRHTRYEIVTSALFSKNGKYILTITTTGVAYLWGETGEKLATLEPEKGEHIAKVFFSPQTDFIIAASRNGTIQTWSMDGKKLNSFQKSRKVLKELALSKTGKEIFILQEERPVYLLDLQGEILREFRHSENIVKMVFSPTKEKMLTVDEENSAKLWTIDGEVQAEFTVPKGEFIKFSPSGEHILSAPRQGIAKIMDLEGKVQHQIDLTNGFYEVSSVEFAPSEKWLLVVLKEHLIKKWELEKGTLKDFVEGYNISGTFTPNGQHALITSLDKKATHYDLDGNLLFTFPHKRPVEWAVMSPDSSSMLTFSKSSVATVWLMPHLIPEWLGDSNLPTLSDQEKKELGIE